MRRLQKSQGLRRIDGQQRTRSQIAKEIGHPKTADTRDDREMQPADVKRGMRRRFDMPEDIDDTHEDEPGSKPNQSARFALQLAREQQRKRHSEVEDHEEQADRLPSAIQAAHIPRNLLWEVAGPDDEPLREIEVSPDHDEGEHELAMVVDFGIRKVLGHWLAFAENTLYHYDEAEGGKCFTRDEEEAVDS